jgi:single-stranded DNA-specific DHH superfamily exonuclease
MKGAIEFLGGIKPTDGVVIIFNNDEDGICACVLIMKVLEKIGCKKPYIISQPMPMDKNLIRRIQTSLPNKIIFLDLAVDQQQGIMKSIGNLCDILIIDHHSVYKNLTGKNIIHYNPRFEKKDVYQSASYVTYKICSKIMDLSEYLWIAAIGMIGDYFLEHSRDLVEEIKKKYEIDDLKKSILYRLSEMISASRATKSLSCEQMVFMFEKAHLEEIEKMEHYDKMNEAYQKIDNEIMSCLLDADTHSEKIGKIVLYNIKSKYNITSPLSTKLSEKYPNSLLVTYERNGSIIKISARNQSNKINAGHMLKMAVRGLKASGGGHEAAGGAKVLERDWDKFKENLIKAVNG